MPTSAELVRHALQLHQAGRLPEAEQLYRQTLAADPDCPDALHLLGMLALQSGHTQPAIELIGRAVKLVPDEATFYGNLGLALAAAGRNTEAQASCERALSLRPDFEEALNNLGLLLVAQDQPERAITHYEHALRLRPGYAEAQQNLGVALAAHGNALFSAGRPDEAEAAYRRAIELRPGDAPLHSNLGTLLHDRGAFDESLRCYEQAIRLAPELAEAHVHRAYNRLLHGDFADGWSEYEWRRKATHGVAKTREVKLPRWDGQPLDGRAILLHAEQGFGDTLQFVRYAAEVKQLGGRITVGCPAELVSLVRSMPDVERVVSELDDLSGLDVEAPLPSLPAIFGTTLESIPCDVPYLHVADEPREAWRQRLSEASGLRIGVAWQGRPTNLRDRLRSFPLAALEPLALLPGVRLFSVQKGAGREQLAAVAGRWPIVDLDGELHEFADTAAALVNLDLVVTCDSAVAHLAGALGVPVHVALPIVPEWRWLLERTDSPWYPRMRLWRQSRAGDWSEVFARLAEHVQTLIPPSGGWRRLVQSLLRPFTPRP